MKKDRIGIDFDDIVLDCYTPLVHFHNTHYGTSHRREDIKSWFLEHAWGCGRDEAVRRVKEWYDSPAHGESLPMVGAVDAIKELSKSHELHIITSRPASIEECTRAWINKYFDGHFSGIHFTSHFDPGARTKADVCKSLSTTLFIEDAPVHAKSVSESGIQVLLLDSPWNQEVVGENIKRVFSWKEILEHVGVV